MAKAIGIIFPGQGSQSVGMVSDLASQFSVVRDVFNDASKVLGYDLWQLSQEGPSAQLNQTEFTQPALLTADVAVWQCWKELGGRDPEVIAGHSLGEYSALVCAESLDFRDALQLVANRGRFMQQAVPVGTGAMAAVIGLTNDAVQVVCDEVPGYVSPANFNSVGQVVLSGERSAVEAACVAAKAAGAKLAKLLPVSVPSHCKLMAPAAERLAASFEGLRLKTPRFPVLQNVAVDASEDPAVIRQRLIDQLTGPVRWVETVEKMRDDFAVVALIECGPGKVLTGLGKRIDKSIASLSISTPTGLESALAFLRGERV